MKRFSSAFLGLTLAFTLGMAPVATCAPPDQVSSTDQIVKGNTAFALALFQQLKGKPGNPFFSPISISSALSMALAGARGDTATEMSKVLGYGPPSPALHASVGKLIAQLITSGNEKGNQLSLANALWLAKGYGLLDEYVSLLKDAYAAGVQESDFAADPDGSRKTINSWIEQKTSGHIKDLLAPGSLGAASRLVLTNAVYFKGTWQSTFDKKVTAQEPFTVSPGKTVTVSMMNQTTYCNYMETPDVQVVELPYKGKALSMVVILPKQEDGLARLEDALNAEALDKLIAGLTEDRVELYLPKFTVRSGFSLGGVLKSLGLAGAFTVPPADFSGMNGRKDLHISEVIHEAFVDVSEKGTEAAAATAMTLGITMSVSKQVFKADHPFLFMIRDTHSKSILFLGRISDPSPQ